MNKRRKNKLQPIVDQPVVKLFNEEPVPDFKEAERLFYANEKAKNRLKRTIAWHRKNIAAFKKALLEQSIQLKLENITHRMIRTILSCTRSKNGTINRRRSTCACAHCVSSSAF
jgi:hypothetical protein